MENGAASPSRWSEAWLDALAFAVGLGLAWVFQWETRDLVWSLWLSSLLVGYAMILWNIFSPVLRQHRAGSNAGAAVSLVGGLFLVAFFTVHFGMFHFVHSAFLNAFFPVTAERSFPGPALYAEVVARYWWFVPVALLAERQAFRLTPLPPAPPPTGNKAADLAARHLRQSPLAADGNAMMQPYKNVIRLHLLIFFFAGAHFLRLDSFLVYAVVYAVYFFPWRLVRRGRARASGG